MDCFIFDGMQYMLHGGNGGIGVGTCRGVRVYLPLCETYALRGRDLDFYVFTSRSARPTPFGDSILIFSCLLAFSFR